MATKRIVSYLPDKTYLNDWMKVSQLVDFFADFYPDFSRQKAADMLAHLEASMLPLIWEGAGDNQFVESGAEPFTARLPARLLPWSGMAFPVRLGAHGNGYVVFTGTFIAPSSDLIVDMHMQSCQVLIDMLACEEKKLAPSEALSEREIACLQMAGDGCISEAIAEKMGLSVHTVNAYLGTATTKLDAVNRIQAIAKAIRLGYIT